jgi:hypothetical protein
MSVYTRRRPGWVGLLVAALVAAVTQVAVQGLSAAPAAATVFANLWTATSASNSEPIKSATAHCPAGNRVFGGGAEIINGGGGVTLATMLPFHGANGDGYSVAATERPGAYLENWSVKAYAICGPAIPGMEIVISATTDPSKVTSANCPGGKVVVGTGAAVGSTRQGAVLGEVSPGFFTSSGYFVYVTAHRTFSPPPDFAVIAAAVCAFEPAGYEINEDADVVDGDVSPINASMTCNGRIALAAGAGFSSDKAFMTSMYTNLFVVRSQARKAQEAPSRIWAHTVFAVCVD